MLDWQQHLTELTLLDAGTSDFWIPVQYSGACASIIPITGVAFAALSSQHSQPVRRIPQLLHDLGQLTMRS